VWYDGSVRTLCLVYGLFVFRIVIRGVLVMSCGGVEALGNFGGDSRIGRDYAETFPD
jgi:hypothetical protein